MNFSPSLSLLAMAAFCLAASPAWSAEAPPARPEPFSPAWALLDTAVAGSTSAALLSVGLMDGGRGFLTGAGNFAQMTYIASITGVPPALMVQVREGKFSQDSYYAATAGGLVGLGAGFFLSRPFAVSPDGSSDGLKTVLAMAVGQGVMSSLGYELFRWYRGFATDLDRLPEQRKDDPLQNWDYYKEKKYR